MNKDINMTVFSFQHLLDIAKTKLRRKWIFNDQYILFSFNESDEDVNLSFLKYPIRLDAMYTLVCKTLESDITIRCDLRDYTVSSNTIFYSRPGCILESYNNVRGSGWVILSAPNYSSGMNLSIQNLLPHFTEISQEHAITIQPDKMAILDNILRMTTQIISDNNATYYSELVKTQTAVFSYEFLSILSDMVKSQENTNRKQKREELYFKQFITLLNEHYIQERSVNFYADQMKVTPKYLSAVVKKATKQSPSDWIEGKVIVEIKNLLKYSDMNIQEISNYMNFPNQSFFGKYFKQRTNMTPTEYREKI